MVALSGGGLKMSEDKAASTQLSVDGGSVVDEILSVFLKKVEAEDGLADAGVRLRKALLETRDDTETLLMAAMFGEAAE